MSGPGSPAGVCRRYDRFLAGLEHSLTRERAGWNAESVSQAESLVGRLHVDLRRHASAICAACR
ncbi:putative leader peptide [Kitasatospora sp. DSM 101779]|uniref:putative leader peptide n=1 Tax=Kitasatospora sp. DSM 101779 TaxID=2853165 RepID=UPI0039875471